LTIDFGIKNEMKGLYNRYSGRVHVGWGRVKGGDEGQELWLMGFIYIYEIE
jgi:hypothetical protein